MKALIRKFLPKPMKNALRSSLESWRLNRIPIQKVKTVPLPDSAAISFGKLLGGDDLSGEWEAARKMISGIFEYVDKGGAINPGDRRVLYYLVRRFKPQSVLEVGTHLGGSTLHIAMALKACRHVGTPPPRLITLDVKDVNDPDARLWTQYGFSASAREMLVRLDCADLVEFTIALSLDYLAKSETQFDFIFLDGSHEARVVYQEIPLVLKALRSGGCLLMHDYYPEGKALWANGVVIPGPYLAVRRLGRDGAGITALPLGVLPWPTKLGSNVTSLAVLVKK